MTPPTLQRQLDAAIEMIIFLIDHQAASARAEGRPDPTPSEAQADVASIVASMPLIEAERPEAALVLAVVIERMAARTRQH